MVSLHCEFTDKADVTETVTKTYSVQTATSKALTESHNGAEDSDQNQRDSANDHPLTRLGRSPGLSRKGTPGMASSPNATNQRPSRLLVPESLGRLIGERCDAELPRHPRTPNQAQSGTGCGPGQAALLLRYDVLTYYVLRETIGTASPFTTTLASCHRNFLPGQGIFHSERKIASQPSPVFLAIRPSSKLKGYRTCAEVGYVDLRGWLLCYTRLSSGCIFQQFGHELRIGTCTHIDGDFNPALAIRKVQLVT
jgi:hypothetical protein